MTSAYVVEESWHHQQIQIAMLHAAAVQIQWQTHCLEDCVLIADAQDPPPRTEFSDACSVVASEETAAAQTCGLLAHLSTAAATHDAADALLDAENLTSQ
jgi:hypothetical protein